MPLLGTLEAIGQGLGQGFDDVNRQNQIMAQTALEQQTLQQRALEMQAYQKAQQAQGLQWPIAQAYANTPWGLTPPGGSPPLPNIPNIGGGMQPNGGGTQPPPPPPSPNVGSPPMPGWPSMPPAPPGMPPMQPGQGPMGTPGPPQQLTPPIGAPPPAASMGTPSPVSNLVAALESDSGRNLNQPPGVVDKTYGERQGFIDQYGIGPTGVNNYTRQVLRANPSATIGGYYASYVLDTGDPAKLSTLDMLRTQQPTAYANLMNTLQQRGISPDTPLAVLQSGKGLAGAAQAQFRDGAVSVSNADPDKFNHIVELSYQTTQQLLEQSRLHLKAMVDALDQATDDPQVKTLALGQAMQLFSPMEREIVSAQTANMKELWTAALQEDREDARFKQIQFTQKAETDRLTQRDADAAARAVAAQDAAAKRQAASDEERLIAAEIRAQGGGSRGRPAPLVKMDRQGNQVGQPFAGYYDWQQGWVDAATQKPVQYDRAKEQVMPYKPPSGQAGAVQKRLEGAINLAAFSLNNLAALPITATGSWFTGVESEKADDLTTGLMHSFARQLTDDDTKTIQQVGSGIGRVFAQIETQGGIQGMQSYGGQIEKALLPQVGDPPLLTMRRLADARGIVETATETALAQNPTPQIAALMQRIRDKVRQSVPFTLADVVELENQVRRETDDPEQIGEGELSDALAQGRATQSIADFGRKILQQYKAMGGRVGGGGMIPKVDNNGNPVPQAPSPGLPPPTKPPPGGA